MAEKLTTVTAFNLEARYPDFKRGTPQFTTFWSLRGT
jgi:hypothetical protein